MTEPEPRPRSRVVWMVVGVVIVVAGLAAIGVAIFGGDSASQPAGITLNLGAAGGSTSTTVLPEGWLPRYDANAKDRAVGMTIPTVTGKDLEGNDLTIGPDGKAKVILFVAHWCPHCQSEVPVLKAYLDEHPMPADVELLTVSTAVRPGADNYPPKDWLDREGWSAPVLADDEASTAASKFGLSAFPFFVAVDADGKVVERRSGDLSTDEFAAAVDAAAGR